VTSWWRRVVGSSIGRKFVMAASGILLLGFLIVHLAGNLLIYSGEHGRAFDEYARRLEENPFLPAAEIGLFVLFAVHIFMALRVTGENRAARRHGYAVRSSMGERTIASSSMIVTGIVVMIFLIVHLADFRIGKLSAANETVGLAELVGRRLKEPLGAAVYLIGVAALGVHLRHAFRSSLQTLGVNHPRLNPLLVRIGWTLAIVLGLGFASFPIFFFTSGASR
jgi:succinate dehydrogenase / fumarate reductase cytochrome b subunit